MNSESLFDIITAILVLDKNGFFDKSFDRACLSLRGQRVVKKIIEADAIMQENK